MAETFVFPPIEPATFDLIVVGTGLPESIIAAAASTVGKTVLHLDPNPFYGSHYGSLPLQELTTFLQSQQNPQPPSPPPPPTESDISDFVVLPITTFPVYSEVEINCCSDAVVESSRKFNIDLAGPRVLFCADLAVDLLLKSGANQYTEFKNVDGSLFSDGSGNLMNVPDSKSAVFKDRTMKYSEKNQLNSFFKRVQGHLEAVRSGSDGGGDESRISDEDLESPFVDFLEKMRLPSKIKSIILYAIAMVDYDQDNVEICKDVLKTKDGIDRLALYHSSVGRFHNALGALIFPIYGQGELPQAFCRRAAVKGCLYVLRMSVIALLMDKVSGSYKGVKLASGQELTSHQLVMDPSFALASPLVSSPSEFVQDSSSIFGARDVKGKLARGICITKSSLKPDLPSCLVIYPPRSLFPEQVTSIRILQLGSNLAICPPGMFVIYISVLCEDAVEGKKLLHAVLEALFSACLTRTAEDNPADQENSEMKPILLWSALYIQELIEGSSGPVISTPTPDGNLNYNDIVCATLKLFQKLYPDEEFFPETSTTSSSDKLEDDTDLGPDGR